MKNPEVLLKTKNSYFLYGADAVFLGGEVARGLSAAGKLLTCRNERSQLNALLPMHITQHISQPTWWRTKGMKRSGRMYGSWYLVWCSVISDMACDGLCLRSARDYQSTIYQHNLSAANYETLNLWKDEGLERVVNSKVRCHWTKLKKCKKKLDVEMWALSTVQRGFL